MPVVAVMSSADPWVQLWLHAQRSPAWQDRPSPCASLAIAAYDPCVHLVSCLGSV